MAALSNLKLGNSRSEERFDRLTRMAVRAFNVPSSQLVLIKRDREWCKSVAGTEISECDRSESFSSHAILGNDVYVIEDASIDARFSDNAQVVGDPYLRFYAGAPISTRDGFKVGALCIIDYVPRTFSEDNIRLLKELAGMAEKEFRSANLNTIDPLTHISNRNGFMRLAENSLQICGRENLPVSVVVFNINGLDRISERYGQDESDHLLNAFADLMRRSFRDSDVFARTGRDEFSLLLTDASELYAEKVVERFHCLVQTYNRQANRGYDFTFETDIISVEPDSDYSIESLLHQVDVETFDLKMPRYFATRTADLAQLPD
ncbi:MAG: sensor domain-containing diguanylate cyclase [Pseudomonadota bacterium]